MIVESIFPQNWNFSPETSKLARAMLQIPWMFSRMLAYRKTFASLLWIARLLVIRALEPWNKQLSKQVLLLISVLHQKYWFLLALVCSPASNKTSWDFSLIDPLMEDFMHATKGHSVIINFSTTPQWMWDTAAPVPVPQDPNQVTIDSRFPLISFAGWLDLWARNGIERSLKKGIARLLQQISSLVHSRRILWWIWSVS